MHKTYVFRLWSNLRRAQGARRFGFAWLGVLLVMTPAQLLIAQSAASPEKGAATPAAALPAPAASPTATPAAVPTATPAVAPAAVPTATPAAAAPQSGVYMRVEVYGTVQASVSSTVTLPLPPGAKPGTKKVTETKVKNATILSLVVTSSNPLPLGNKGILYRKVEAPGNPAATQWLKVAELTLRKVEDSGKMMFDVDSEEKDVLINGKKENHFAKGTRIKVQIDVKVAAAP